MRKQFIILVLAMVCGGFACAQSLMRPKDKIFNFGLKVGLRAMEPDINSIQVDGLDVGDIQVKNGMGYTAGFLIRVNIDRFFVQPSAFWNHSKADVSFNIVEPASEELEELEEQKYPQSLKMDIKSLEVPIVVGYHLIKERPYVLSVMGGVKMKYNYDVSYTSNETYTTIDYMEDSTPYHLSAYGAMEVFIGKLTFDIGYEYGLNRLNSDFRSISYREGVESPTMNISKRLNGLSMSIGMMF